MSHICISICFSCSCSSSCWLIHLSSYLAIYLSTYLLIYPSIHLSIDLSICKFENTYQSVYLQVWKRSNSARLPQLLNLITSKRKQFCKTSSVLENEAILRDVLSFWSWQHQKRSNPARLPSIMESCVQSWWPVSKVLCLPRKSEARSHKIIFPKLKIWCSKNPYKLAGGPRPTPSPSRTFPSHQWRLVRCAPTWYVQIQKQHRCLYNRIHHKVSVWSVGFFCGSTVAAMREIQSVKSPLDTKKSWDVTRIVSFFNTSKLLTW